MGFISIEAIYESGVLKPLSSSHPLFLMLALTSWNALNVVS